jgi:hypothetical protein
MFGPLLTLRKWEDSVKMDLKETESRCGLDLTW